MYVFVYACEYAYYFHTHTYRTLFYVCVLRVFAFITTSIVVAATFSYVTYNKFPHTTGTFFVIAVVACNI